MRPTSGLDFKAEFVRLGLPVYKIAAEIELHPSRLSTHLNSDLPPPEQLASRLQAILERERLNRP